MRNKIRILNSFMRNFLFAQIASPLFSARFLIKFCAFEEIFLLSFASFASFTVEITLMGLTL